jgi:hypothetical protein
MFGRFRMAEIDDHDGELIGGVQSEYCAAVVMLVQSIAQQLGAIDSSFGAVLAHRRSGEPPLGDDDGMFPMAETLAATAWQRSQHLRHPDAGFGERQSSSSELLANVSDGGRKITRGAL